MKAIILAGGRGTRLPESAKDIPKALVKVNELPIVEHQLNLLKMHNISDVIFSLGFRSDQLIDYIKGKYEYVVESYPLGTGGAIKYASSSLSEPFLVLNGDILSDINFSDFISSFEKRSSKLLGSVAVVWMENCSDYGLVKHKKTEEGFFIVEEFLEKPNTPMSGHINAGVYILTPEALSHKKEEIFSIEKDVFPELSKKGKISAYFHSGNWMDVGTEDRLKTARSINWLFYGDK